jgi:hypothetical protein
MLKSRRRSWALAAAALTIATACVPVLASSAGAAGSRKPAAECQPFGVTPCLLPFPNNLFTVPDRSTPTGLRVHLPANAMPVNARAAAAAGAAFFCRRSPPPSGAPARSAC